MPSLPLINEGDSLPGVDEQCRGGKFFILPSDHGPVPCVGKDVQLCQGEVIFLESTGDFVFVIKDCCAPVDFGFVPEVDPESKSSRGVALFVERRQSSMMLIGNLRKDISL